jgi:lipocalin-like protein
MNRRHILSLSAIAALGLSALPGNAVAQQKTLKEQLVGTWTLVSAEAVEPNGTRMPLVKGTDVKGLQIFTDSGKVSFQLIGGHAKIASNDPMKMTPDEMKATAESVLSYFGSYTVNEAEKSYAIQIESSSFTNQTANPAKRMVALTGDEMTVTNPGRLAGGQTITVWKRTK